ncbi:unnamed protein product [Didymodactylos carnosus]|uniref:Uncharacterized protein n=1 Tax=Didymodactylos carnosus TaxID=1234261 RepID=A0A813VIX1_9BILA|nr:unnamed protein product [Didymodactylos carnosus]CAF1168938.1 unnamed protein product [Didymodactylos carnosus]CAF3628256.1 unnamed protein product [Didymodactylos carnosus]CAF3980413.1 unnamed protein product [Didymodactylos carnosus]
MPSSFPISIILLLFVLLNGYRFASVLYNDRSISSSHYPFAFLLQYPSRVNAQPLLIPIELNNQQHDNLLSEHTISTRAAFDPTLTLNTKIRPRSSRNSWFLGSTYRKLVPVNDPAEYNDAKYGWRWG